MVSAVTAELENAAAETASDVIGHIIAVEVARRLDGVVFDDVAADDVRPAGLLYGLTALGASTGTGLEAVSEDIGNLAGAVGDAGVSTDGMIIVANSRQAARLTVLSPNYDDSRVFGSPQIPAGRVIGISLDAVGSAYGGRPTVEKSKNAAIHFEDTAPTDIGIEGTPPSVAAPVRSAFQTNLIAIKIRCRAAWGRIAPGVSFIDNVSW